jgi:acyl carrier protein
LLDRTNHTPTDRVTALVRRVMVSQSIAKPIGPDDEPRAYGLSSVGLVNLMLSIEAEFGLEVPEQEMTPANFCTIARIVELVNTLSGQSALSG